MATALESFRQFSKKMTVPLALLSALAVGSLAKAPKAQAAMFEPQATTQTYMASDVNLARDEAREVTVFPSLARGEVDSLFVRDYSKTLDNQPLSYRMELNRERGRLTIFRRIAVQGKYLPMEILCKIDSKGLMSFDSAQYNYSQRQLGVSDFFQNLVRRTTFTAASPEMQETMADAAKALHTGGSLLTKMPTGFLHNVDYKDGDRTVALSGVVRPNQTFIVTNGPKAMAIEGAFTLPNGGVRTEQFNFDRRNDGATYSLATLGAQLQERLFDGLNLPLTIEQKMEIGKTVALALVWNAAEAQGINPAMILAQKGVLPLGPGIVVRDFDGMSPNQVRERALNGSQAVFSQLAQLSGAGGVKVKTPGRAPILFGKRSPQEEAAWQAQQQRIHQNMAAPLAVTPQGTVPVAGPEAAQAGINNVLSGMPATKLMDLQPGKVLISYGKGIAIHPTNNMGATIMTIPAGQPVTLVRETRDPQTGAGGFIVQFKDNKGEGFVGMANISDLHDNTRNPGGPAMPTAPTKPTGMGSSQGQEKPNLTKALMQKLGFGS